MTSLTTTAKTMSSIELFNLISSERLNAGESKPRLNDFHARLVDELDGDHYENFVVQNPNNTKTTAYKLTIEQCTLIGMRESKSVRRKVLAKLKELESPKPMTQLEVLAGLTNAMVEQERRQLEQAEAVKAIESKLELVEAKANSQVWDECPINALPISAIRQRMGLIDIHREETGRRVKTHYPSKKLKELILSKAIKTSGVS